MEQWIDLLRKNIVDLEPGLQEYIYRSYYHFVYRDIYFLVRDHAAVEDIIQDAFIKIVAHGPGTYAANMQGWIKKVTRNTALDAIRKNNKGNIQLNVDSLTTAAPYLAAASDVVSNIEDKWRNELLHQTIHELKPDYRSLLLLYYIEEKPYKTICQELNLSPSIVTQRLYRARKKLLQQFLKKWMDPDN